MMTLEKLRVLELRAKNIQIKVKKGTTFGELKGSLAIPVSPDDGPFKWWSLTENGVALDDSYIFDTDVATLHAVYSGVVAIIFDMQGGQPTHEPLTVPYATTLETVEEMIEPPKKDGFIFTGWELDYNATKCVIEFEIGDGTPQIPNYETDYGTHWGDFKSKIKSPSKTGYNFSHWSLTANGDPIADEHQFNTNLVTIYAVYSVKMLVINFETAGGQPTHEPLAVPYGTYWHEVAAELTDPEKEGHTFNHWSLTRDGQAIDNNQYLTVEEFTVYAVYDINQLTINFNAVDSSNIQDSMVVNYGTTWEEIKNNVKIPVKEHYDFQHWSLTEDGDPIADDCRFIAGSNELFAVFELSKISITFAETDIQPKLVYYGSTWAMVKSTIKDPVKQGHTFKWWSLDGADAIPDEHRFLDNTTISAVFEINRIEITIETFTDSPPGPITSMYGATWQDIKQQLETPVRVGYTFKRWALVENGPEIDNSYIFTGSCTLYAVWQIIQVTVKFDTQGSLDTPQDLIINYGTTWSQIKNTVPYPSMDGHTFLHWSSTVNGDIIPDGFVFTEQETTIHAVFTIKEITITFDSAGGEPVQTFVYTTYGDTWANIKEQAIEPVRTGYDFVGWKLNDTDIEDSHVFTESVTVIAQWNASTVTVTFNANGGEPTPSPQVITVGTTWAQIKDSVQAPSKPGYRFTGWEVTK